MARTLDPGPRLGLLLVLLGFLTYGASRLIDGGFVGGMFQGMTVALMIGGAWLIGSLWRDRDRDDDGGDQMWLPSRGAGGEAGSGRPAGREAAADDA